MFWASPGPASHNPFPWTAISFLFFSFSFSLLPPDLLPIPQGRAASLENHKARFCHWVPQFTEVEIYTVAVSLYLLAFERFLVASSAPWDGNCLWKLQKPLRHTTFKRGNYHHDYHLRARSVTACFYWPSTDLLHHVGNIRFLLLLKSTWFAPSKKSVCGK